LSTIWNQLGGKEKRQKLQWIKAAKRHPSHQKKFGGFGLACLSEKVATDRGRPEPAGGGGEATEIAMDQPKQPSAIPATRKSSAALILHTCLEKWPTRTDRGRPEPAGGEGEATKI
jgi:hypothetical protein